MSSRSPSGHPELILSWFRDRLRLYRVDPRPVSYETYRSFLLSTVCERVNLFEIAILFEFQCFAIVLHAFNDEVLIILKISLELIQKLARRVRPLMQSY